MANLLQLDLSAGATGDTSHMGIGGAKVKSQSKARSDTVSNIFHGFRIEDAHIIDPLPPLVAGKKKPEPVEGNGQHDVTFDPHGRRRVRRWQRRIERDLHMMRQDGPWRGGAERNNGTQEWSARNRRRQDNGRSPLDHFGRAEPIREIDPKDGSGDGVDCDGQAQPVIGAGGWHSWGREARGGGRAWGKGLNDGSEEVLGKAAG